MGEDMSTDGLRSLGELLAVESNLSESQALVYAFRAIGKMERQEAIMELDMNPSTLDTHFQRAKDKMKTARLQTYLDEIYRGNTLHLREGMTLPTVPEQWRAMPVQFEDESGKEVQLFELPDNRVAKCTSQQSNHGVHVEAVGWFRFTTYNLNWEEFENHFDDQVGIETNLSNKSKLTLGAAYQTMVEYAVTQWLQGNTISREFKYMKVERANLSESPSWVEVSSNDELVAATMSESLEAAEGLQKLENQFLEVFDEEKHALLDSGMFDPGSGKKNQFFAHVAQAFCRASGTDYPLTFDWEIDTRDNRKFQSLDERQGERFRERNYWIMAYEHHGYRLNMIEGNTGISI